MSGHKILIVEDDKKMREALHQIMRDEGYVVESAKSGEEALRCVKEKNYDMVLSDIKLPGIDGMDVLRVMQEKHMLEQTYVIMLSAYGVYDNVVFSNGLLADDDGTLTVYYGAGDRICAAAVTTVDEMVAAAKA